MSTETNCIAAEDHHFKLYKGDTWETELTFTDELDAAVDLGAALLKMQIKRNANDVEVLKELSIGSGLVLSGTGNNIVTISTVADLPATQYVYDLQATYPGGKVTTFLRGIITITEDVTR